MTAWLAFLYIARSIHIPPPAVGLAVSKVTVAQGPCSITSHSRSTSYHYIIVIDYDVIESHEMRLISFLGKKLQEAKVNLCQTTILMIIHPISKLMFLLICKCHKNQSGMIVVMYISILHIIISALFEALK